MGIKANKIPPVGNRGKRPDPNQPTALYRHYDKKGRLLYVGISLNHISRLVGHRSNADWFKEIAQMTIEWHPNREQAEWAEIVAIKKEKPIHNKERYDKVAVMEQSDEETIRELPDDPRLLNLIIGIAEKVNGFEKRMDNIQSEFFEVLEKEREIIKHMVDYENISSWFKEKNEVPTDENGDAINAKTFVEHFQYIHHFMDKIILGLELVGYQIDHRFTPGYNSNPKWSEDTKVWRGKSMKSLYGHLDQKIDMIARHLNAKICRYTGNHREDYSVYVKPDPLPTGSGHNSRWMLERRTN